MRELIIKSVFVMGCLYSGYMSAACIQNPSFNNIQVNFPVRSYTVQYDDASVKNLDTFVVYIASEGIRSFSGSNNGQCGSNATLNADYINSWVPNSSKIAPSNITGIGLAISNSNLANTSLLNFVHGPLGGTGDRFFFSSPYRPQWTITIKKTGAVNSGGYLRSGAVARLTQHNYTPTTTTWNLSTLSIPANAIKINVLSCSLTNNKNTYDINMGDWYDTQFKNINDTQGTTAIPIALSCLSGTNIKVTVTSDNIDNAANGQLGLTGADKATGISLQLLNNVGTPIVLNQQFTQQDGVTQTDYIFGWKARYIKTAATVTPGTANANATVNIRYE
ncbi:TPA: fimbrial protein [Providencia alcalifaciens]|nr:fimbrial protein [Providencia alcalifaciens]HEQ1860265.1 fimbrial protein [Providencia alcalifaciens]